MTNYIETIIKNVIMSRVIYSMSLNNRFTSYYKLYT